MEERKPPKHLKSEGRAFWEAVVGGFEIQEYHYAVLQTCCEALDDVAEARAMIAADGMVLKSEGKLARTHPATRVLKDSQMTFLRAQRELGVDQEPPGDIGRPPGPRGQ